MNIFILLKKCILIIAIVVNALTNHVFAQSVKDSAFRILMVGVHLSGQIPQLGLLRVQRVAPRSIMA